MSPGHRHPLHIVMLCDEYPPALHGGVGTMNRLLARSLVERGHAVTVLGVHRQTADPQAETVLARHASVDPATEGAAVRVLRLRQPRSPIPSVITRALLIDRELRRIHARLPIDIVEGPEIFHGGAVGRRPWQRLIRMHGGHHFFRDAADQPVLARRAWLERRSFAKADHLCAVSRWVAERTRELLHLGDREITVIPNPVDTEHFSPGPTEGVVTGRIVFAGSLVAKKGVFELVDAFGRLASRLPQAHLVLCGRDTSQNGRSVRQLLSEQLPEDQRQRLDFRGPLPHGELIDVLRSAEILAYPSHMEAMPMAWLEGLSLGKPVVASNTGPGPEVIDDEVTGLLCDPTDVDQIADRLTRLFDDPALRHRLGAAARAAALERFSIEQLADRNVEFYRSLTGTSTPH